MSTIVKKIAALRTRLASDELVGEFLFFSLSTGTYQVSRLGVNLIAAKWLGPEQFGTWNALYLFLLYGVLVNLGVPSGMNREIPLLKGAGQVFRAKLAENTGFSFVLISSSLGGILTIGLLATGVVHSLTLSNVLIMGFLFITWQIYQYFQLILRSNIRFRIMTIQQFIFSALLPVVVLPLTRSTGLKGFVGGQAIVAGLTIVAIWRMTSFKPVLEFAWPMAKSLIRIGFPIMSAGLLYSLLTSVDRWVILHFMGVEALGKYTLAILSVGILNLLPAVISQQLYPRMAYIYGSTSQKRSLLPLVLRQSLASAVVTIPLITMAILFMPFLVSSFLPEYIEGVSAARILLVGLGFIPLAGGFINYLNTTDRQMTYLRIQILAILLNLSLDVLLVERGLGLKGVALGAASTYVAYSLLLIVAGGLDLLR